VHVRESLEQQHFVVGARVVTQPTAPSDTFSSAQNAAAWAACKCMTDTLLEEIAKERQALAAAEASKPSPPPTTRVYSSPLLRRDSRIPSRRTSIVAVAEQTTFNKTDAKREFLAVKHASTTRRRHIKHLEFRLKHVSMEPRERTLAPSSSSALHAHADVLPTALPSTIASLPKGGTFDCNLKVPSSALETVPSSSEVGCVTLPCTEIPDKGANVNEGNTKPGQECSAVASDVGIKVASSQQTHERPSINAIVTPIDASHTREPNTQEQGSAQQGVGFDSKSASNATVNGPDFSMPSLGDKRGPASQEPHVKEQCVSRLSEEQGSTGARGGQSVTRAAASAHTTHTVHTVHTANAAQVESDLKSPSQEASTHCSHVLSSASRDAQEPASPKLIAAQPSSIEGNALNRQPPQAHLDEKRGGKGYPMLQGDMAAAAKLVAKLRAQLKRANVEEIDWDFLADGAYEEALREQALCNEWLEQYHASVRSGARVEQNRKACFEYERQRDMWQARAEMTPQYAERLQAHVTDWRLEHKAEFEQSAAHVRECIALQKSLSGTDPRANHPPDTTAGAHLWTRRFYEERSRLFKFISKQQPDEALLKTHPSDFRNVIPNRPDTRELQALYHMLTTNKFKNAAAAAKLEEEAYNLLRGSALHHKPEYGGKAEVPRPASAALQAPGVAASSRVAPPPAGWRPKSTAQSESSDKPDTRVQSAGRSVARSSAFASIHSALLAKGPFAAR
jgi:hypothetical protein